MTLRLVEPVSGMNCDGTAVDYHPDVELWVKHEELCCPGGPNFSKTRGVFAHVQRRTNAHIGVLDTSHSQGGWAVARACQMLDRRCFLYYPYTMSELRRHGSVEAIPLREPQAEAQRLGAVLRPIPAGRSAVLYHRASALLRQDSGGDGYMMPNALKLPEMVTQTMLEVGRTDLPLPGCPLPELVLISASSGTIAAGVISGFEARAGATPITYVVHMGYSRSEGAVKDYMIRMAPVVMSAQLVVVDEGYAYGEPARANLTSGGPAWPCNKFYDLKAYNWWVSVGRHKYTQRPALMWNIG